MKTRRCDVFASRVLALAFYLTATESHTMREARLEEVFVSDEYNAKFDCIFCMVFFFFFYLSRYHGWF